MTFISLTYVLFLAVVLGIYWLMLSSRRTSDARLLISARRSRSLSWRLWVLIIASLIFYASLQIQYIPLLLLITLIIFSLGKAIGTNTAPGQHTTNQRLSFFFCLFV